MTLMSLMRMLSDGPDVSLNGSPTVSPMTFASCTGFLRFFLTPASLVS